MVGSITPWKATEYSPKSSTARLACECERRGYLWGGLVYGGSNIGGGAGNGTSGGSCGAAGVTLGGVWGSALSRSMGSGAVVWVRLVIGLVVSVDVPATVKMTVGCQIVSLV